MPITVVTHRDDVGAPTNREVYAVGARYRLGPSGLEIFSADRRVLALYPDGNWLSVYLDNSVRVHTEGRPEEEPVPRLGTVAAASDAAVVDDVLQPDEILAAEPGDAAPRADDATFGAEVGTARTIDAEPVDAGTVGDESATEVRDAGQPDDDEQDDDERADAPAAEATPERTNFPPPGMRPVTFRPRVLRPARRPEEPSRPTHMRPLVFRARTYRKRDE